MLQAILKGKLTPEEERMEDILTSNVFGALKYVPAEDALLPFLCKAIDCEQQPLGSQLPSKATAEYDFWPWLHEGDCYPAQPDVVITLKDQSGDYTAILVEAKYLSGKSTSCDGSGKPFDQLAREWDNFVLYCRRKGIRKYHLVFCTADLALPATDIAESEADFRRSRQSECKIHWVSWRSLPDLLSSARKPILSDLRDVLLKLGLHFYEGVEPPSEPMEELLVPWRFDEFDWTVPANIYSERIADMATDDGAKILRTIQFLRGFTKQVSLYLRTAEDLMKNAGWVCIHPASNRNVCISSSASLEHPESWIPWYAFRFYMRPNKERNVMTFVAVLLDNSESYQIFEEPLATAGCFAFDPKLPREEILRTYRYDWCTTHPLISQASDGAIFEDPWDKWSEEDKIASPYFRYQATLGLPLTEIKNAGDIERKVIQPLLGHVEMVEQRSFA
jgi:hypothetical protein